MRTKEEILKEIDRLKGWIESADKELETNKNPFVIESFCAAKYDWKKQIDKLTEELESLPKETLFTPVSKEYNEQISLRLKRFDEYIKSTVKKTKFQNNMNPQALLPTEIIKEHVAAINEQIRLISEDKNFNATIEASIKEKEAYDNSLIIPRYVKFPYLEIKITETL